MAETSRRIVARAQAEVLEQVDEVAQEGSGDLTWIAYAPGKRELRQPLQVAEVGDDGVLAVTRLEREEVAEALQPEIARGALAHVGDRHAPRCA